MKIEITHRFIADAPSLLAVLASRELVAARAKTVADAVQQDVDALPDYSFQQVTDAFGRIEKTAFSFTLPANILPAQARKFLARGAQVQIASRFTPAAPANRNILQTDAQTAPSLQTDAGFDATNSAQVIFDVQIQGAPVKLSGQALIRELDSASNDAANTETELTYRGELQINLPFIGKMLESKAQTALPKIFQRDCMIIADLLK